MPVQASASVGEASVVVLHRDDETVKGEVWSVDVRGIDAPRQLWILDGHPRSARLCTSAADQRFLEVSVDRRTMKEIGVSPRADVLSTQTFELR